MAAHIGDFRELAADCNPRDLYSIHNTYRLTSPAVQLALKLCCWLNSHERAVFGEPEFSISGESEKYQYFLDRFLPVVQNIDAYETEWR